MDNLTSHKSSRAVVRIEEAGARVLYLPPYSPDLNPIEKIFSKMKSVLRKAKARSEAALHDSIARALKTITPDDCQNTFHACGYRLHQT